MNAPLFLFLCLSPYTYSTLPPSTNSTGGKPATCKTACAGAENSTAAGKPWILLWHTYKPNRSDAIKLELKLKNLSRTRTLHFIQKYTEDINGQQALTIIEALIEKG